MSDKRRNIQLELAFMAEGRREAPRAVDGGTESLAAACRCSGRCCTWARSTTAKRRPGGNHIKALQCAFIHSLAERLATDTVDEEVRKRTTTRGIVSETGCMSAVLAVERATGVLPAQNRRAQR